MNLKCVLGAHVWTGCKCAKCSKTRDDGHKWADCKCTICGKVRDEDHRWVGCKCATCGKVRNAAHDWHFCKCKLCGKARYTKDDFNTEHDWHGCKCTICGRIRDLEHDWGETRCRICRADLSADEVARRWAQKLESTKDYHALAAKLCAYIGRDGDVHVSNAKNHYAEDILRKAGAEAVDAMLAELERGERKESSFANILVGIGDPRAVRLLKRLNDRDEWHGAWPDLTAFLDKYPEFHGTVETMPCPICGKVRPVTETKQCEDKRFCEGSCWSKRGRVIRHGIGRGCPHYTEGVCMIDGGDTGLCSLWEGTYATSCHVYAAHPA